MIFQTVTRLFNRRNPRSTVFFIFGFLSFLTICISLLYLSSLNGASSIVDVFGMQDDKEVGVSAPGQPAMTSSSTGPVVASPQDTMTEDEQPYHHHHRITNNPQSLQMPLLRNHDTKEEEEEELTEMTKFSNRHPPIIPSPTLIADLPASAILPSAPKHTSSPAPKSRIIIVGDVHGNLQPLKRLLKKIEFSPHNNYDIEGTGNHGGRSPKTRDHLIFVGDMITRGPDSRGVVDLAMKVGASAVRGNHEDRVLAAARGMRRLDRKDWTAQDLAGENQYNSDEDDDPSEASEEGEDDSSSPEILRKKKKKKDDHARKVAKSLSRSQLRWLESLPVILRIGHFPVKASPSPPWDAGTIVVVHGGLVPGVKLESQDPWAVMNVRSLLYPRRHRHKKPKSKEATTVSSSSNLKLEAEEEKETESLAPKFKELAVSPNTSSTSRESSAEEEEEEEEEEKEEINPSSLIAVPIDTRKGEPWSAAWNRFQNLLPSSLKRSRTTVIYGHDAKAGLQTDIEVDISPSWPGSSSFSSSPPPPPSSKKKGDSGEEQKKKKKKEKNKKKDKNIDDDEEEDNINNNNHGKHKKIKGTRYAFGLDSGCGHGKQLTALVIEIVEGHGGVGHRIVQVDCGVGGKDEK
ncbi:hypothetical protein QBC42DRAFT_275247 [Cladorrhinum samala]|uniref:Calcineurin-like phosphoesterase domain-containing protein n=1 Tax=Cladorrhinum samala TaxID=585594 RepID=A0AAV9HEW8_9PEZI|nr:hypothetical protein QBC42DRAFT_275247 [Cladorrhinum samala]